MKMHEYIIPVQILWKKLFNRDWTFHVSAVGPHWSAECALALDGERHLFCSGEHDDIESTLSVLSIKIITDFLIPYGSKVNSHDVDYWINWRAFKNLKYPQLERATYTRIGDS